MKPLLTARQRIRPFTLADAPFILRLLNEPSFIENIVDLEVRTLEQAEGYLRKGPLAMYETFGHGLWLAEDGATGTAMGMCGLIKRDILPEVDLGYAYLPEHWGRGYAREAAAACMAHGRDQLGLRALLAIVSPGNGPSIRLLEALGFRPESSLELGPGDVVTVFRATLA
jgi:RimJ/RimL family protein N-acetyltransferase